LSTTISTPSHKILNKKSSLFVQKHKSEFVDIFDVDNELQSNGVHGAKRDFMIACNQFVAKPIHKIMLCMNFAKANELPTA